MASASSVQGAVKGLLEKDFITNELDTYTVYDKFFDIWLKMFCRQGILTASRFYVEKIHAMPENLKKSFDWQMKDFVYISCLQSKYAYLCTRLSDESHG